MKTPVLEAMMTEVNRLFIAGAKLAAGDPRLLRLVPTLEQMGQRAPVFKRLAADTAALASASPEDAGARLLALGTLLYAVLYTQGDTAAAGDYTPLEPAPGASAHWAARTEVSYGRLNPLLEALTTQKAGRLEVIATGFRDGLFADLRTHGPAVRALDDRYSEIVILLEQTVIPAIGAGAVPHLLAQYDPKGERGAGRRLSLLGRLSYPGAEALAHAALETEGAGVPVCVAAIGILGRRPENETLLLALAKDKKKELREAALTALASLDSSRGKELLTQAFCGKGYKVALEAMAQCRDRAVKATALGLVEALEREVVAGTGDKKEQAARCERYVACAGALVGLPQAPFIDYMRHVLTSAPLRQAAGIGNRDLQNLYHAYLAEIDALPDTQAAAILMALCQDDALCRFYDRPVALWFRKAAKSLSSAEMYRAFFHHFVAGQLDARVIEQVYPQDTVRHLDPHWIEPWLKSANLGFKFVAIRHSDPLDWRHRRALCALLEQAVEELSVKKIAYRPNYMPHLLEKLLVCGVDLKKELKPQEAQLILTSRGNPLTQQVQDALAALLPKN